MKDDVQSLSHSKWRCKYHIVFAPKYRRQIIYGKIKADVGKILRELSERKGVEILEAECCRDHIHMLVSIPPHMSVAQYMGYLKSKSSLMIFDRHANLKYKYGNRHFWCRGSVGRIKNGVKTLRYLTTTAIANSVSALIRQFWTASSPNTEKPQRSRSKTSNSTCNADKELCSELERRIDREFAEYEDVMLEHSTAYVFAKCGEINAMCTCYNLLTIKLVQAADMPCIDYLARFRQPLKVICEEWMRREDKQNNNFDSLLQVLMESGSAESRSDFDPDWVVKHCSQAMH